MSAQKRECGSESVSLRKGDVHPFLLYRGMHHACAFFVSGPNPPLPPPLRLCLLLLRQMKQDMNRLGEDYEHSMARFLQLKRNSEESVTQARKGSGAG